MVVYSLDDSQPMILLANLPVGLRGPQARENIPFVAAFCQLRWQKAATKRSPFGGLGPPNLPIGSKPAECEKVAYLAAVRPELVEGQAKAAFCVSPELVKTL